MDELYFSVVILDKKSKLYLNEESSEQGKDLYFIKMDGEQQISIRLADEIYLWAIWDIWPSMDVYRSPILSGMLQSKDEISKIAEQYGLDKKINFDNDHHFNKRLYEYAHSNYKLISYIKRESGLYYFVAWVDEFNYLIGAEPMLQEDNISEQEIKLLCQSLAPNYYFSENCHNGSYIGNYIRKKEAFKKFKAVSKGTTEALLIEFIYAASTDYYGKDKIKWSKHRVIKKTKSHVYIDKYSFCSSGYLRQGWQARVIYTTMINRQTIESVGEFYHHSLRKTFYSKDTLKKKDKRFFKKENLENDGVIEVPQNGIQWALNLLLIESWPVNPEIIRKSFARAALKHHPDRGGDPEIFMKCKAAKDFLMDKIST